MRGVAIADLRVGDVIVNWRWTGRPVDEFDTDAYASYTVTVEPTRDVNCVAVTTNGTHCGFGTSDERSYTCTISRKQYANPESAAKLRAYLEKLL